MMYGIDAPNVVRNLTVAATAYLVVGICLVLFSTKFFGMLVLVGAAFTYATVLSMLLSSKFLKMRARDRILNEFDWQGDERVLDVGCGRGLMLLGAAKRLTAGSAVGVDIWSGRDQSANSREVTLDNARVEGVLDRVEIVDADARELPFADSSFDVVLSSLVIHNIKGRSEQANAVKEIARVLKPGGRVAILDVWSTRLYVQVLEESGLKEVRRKNPAFLFGAIARTVTAVK